MTRDTSKKHVDIALAHESCHAAEHLQKMAAICFWLVTANFRNPVKIFVNYQLHCKVTGSVFLSKKISKF